mgnify:FL=1
MAARTRSRSLRPSSRLWIVMVAMTASPDAAYLSHGAFCRHRAGDMRSAGSVARHGGLAPAAVRAEGDAPDCRRCRCVMERDTTRLPMTKVRAGHAV